MKCYIHVTSGFGGVPPTLCETGAEMGDKQDDQGRDREIDAQLSAAIKRVKLTLEERQHIRDFTRWEQASAECFKDFRIKR